MKDCGRGIFIRNNVTTIFCLCFAAEDMDQYLHYVGGPVGALALTCVAAGSAYYLASRPVPEKPLVPLHQQSFLLPVSSAQVSQNNQFIYFLDGSPSRKDLLVINCNS